MTVAQGAPTLHILKNIFNVSLRKVESKHVKHKVFHYFSVAKHLGKLPGLHKMLKQLVFCPCLYISM